MSCESHPTSDDCAECAVEEAAEILQEVQTKSLRLLMERGKTISELRTALAAVVSEADFVLRGGDCPEETCQECGLYGVGMLRDALTPARALLERTK